VHLDAIEHDDTIVFLHKVNDGPANQSYGLQVAKLAGVPRDVVEQAKLKLMELENQAVSQNLSPQQTDLFTTQEHPVLEKIRQLKPDQMMPMDALKIIYDLQEMI